MKTKLQTAIGEALAAQAKNTEAVEAMAAFETVDLDAADVLLHAAMTRLVAARSAVREAARERAGLQTIEGTRRATS